jgi:hypothetical protein
MAATATRHNDTGVLVIGGLAVAALLLYRHVLVPNIVVPTKLKNDAERLRIGKLQKVKLNKDTVEFDFPVENPNSDAMTIKAIVGDVYVSDASGKQAVKLGAVNHFGTDVIKPTAATNFQLIAKINLVNEFIYISNVLAGKWKGGILSFRGTVNVNNRPWPVNESIRLM